MRLARTLLPCAAALLLCASAARADSILEEHVTGGALDRVWVNGFDTSSNMQPLTIPSGDPAYANPSGDHTAAAAVNAPPDSGGLIVTLTDPQGVKDYKWDAWMFTGAGDSRRGLIVRADPANNYKSFYLLALYSGLSQLAFRRFVDGTPTTLASWTTFALPGGAPAQNTWHKITVTAQDSVFRCFWDDVELTTPDAIVDRTLPTGWVGAYNFNFSTGGIAALFDDLVLTLFDVTPARLETWGAVKSKYRK